MANARIVNTPSQAIAQNGTIHRQNTIGAAAENVLNWSLNSGTTHVLVQIGGADVRVTFDGVTDPTASIGFKMPSGSSAYWTRQMVTTAKAIREATTDAVIEAQELNYL
jgi:hypothetical protein